MMQRKQLEQCDCAAELYSYCFIFFLRSFTPEIQSSERKRMHVRSIIFSIVVIFYKLGQVSLAQICVLHADETDCNLVKLSCLHGTAPT